MDVQTSIIAKRFLFTQHPGVTQERTIYDLETKKIVTIGPTESFQTVEQILARFEKPNWRRPQTAQLPQNQPAAA